MNRREGQNEHSASAKRSRGASLARYSLVGRLYAYVESHLQALIFSLGRISRSPLSSLMTIAVIAIALAMPSGLHLLLKNLQGVSEGWDNAAQISLFLQHSLSSAPAEQLAQHLRAMPEIDQVEIILPQQALAEFQRLSDFGDALNVLDDNPFPVVLVVRPAAAYSAPAAAKGLLLRLQSLAEVDIAQLDMEWLERWYAVMEIGKRAVLILGILLALAVLLIIGNTIRLAIQNCRDEIEVQKLIGATDAFIRRPFLYSGFWHGLLGAMLAWLLVNGSIWLLDGPVQKLSLLYEGNMVLRSLSGFSTLFLWISGMALGYSGARLAVGRHLRDIEPS